MLSHLTIRNFTLIDHLELPLNTGLTVVTGETGAGKSIVFDAISLLLGGRAQSDLIRSGRDEATVQGHFLLRGSSGRQVEQLLDERGLPHTDGELLVRRNLSREGVNRVFVNDSPATAGLLASLLAPLVDLLGQHQHLTLMKPETHLRMLDAFGDHDDAREAYRDRWNEWRAAAAELANLRAAASDRLQRIDFLKFQLHELETLNLREGEYDALEEELGRARNATRLNDAAAKALTALRDGRSSGTEQLGVARQALERAGQLDDTADGFAERAEEVGVLINDLAHDLDAWTRSLQNIGDIDDLESRHEAIRQAMRKHACDDQELLRRVDQMRDELSALEEYEVSLAEAQRAEATTLQDAVEAALHLAQRRREAADELFGRLVELLDAMAMPGTRLALDERLPVEGGERDALHEGGIGRLEILFSANPGEPPQAIGRIASGGELSRLMLAFKTVLMENDPVATCIFDEIDTGIGGATGEVVGRLLKELAAERQVLCITHLPQIASFGRSHLRVLKTVEGERTVSRMEALDAAQREEEIARMLGGQELTRATREHARDMIRNADES